MSQHFFTTRYEGRSVTVVVGFDRPLRGFFCFVERNDANGDDDEQFVYSNLDDPKLAGCLGMPKSLRYFVKRLDDLGLVVPRSMFDEAECDRLGNVGNRCVWHDEKGVAT
jgi:hypothetical protein